MLKTQEKEESYYQPRECDVICGRGKTFAGHPGNKVFLRLVRSSLKDYVNATGRFDRTLIVSHIAANFREYGVRFARVGPAQPGMSAHKKQSPTELLKSFRFYEINDDRKIHEKIGHAFRDMIRAQSSRSTTPAESSSANEEESSSPAVDESDSEPAPTISRAPTKVIPTRRKRPKKSKEQAPPKPRSQENATTDTCVSSSKTTDKETFVTGVSSIEKTQMVLTKKGHGPQHQDNFALTFFEVESHVHKFRDEKPQEETDEEDPLGPDVSLLFIDSESLGDISFNSTKDTKDSQRDFLWNKPEDFPEKIVVHCSKEHQFSIKRATSDSSRDRSLVKRLESNYDGEVVRWSASSHGTSTLDPCRLLQEPLINDWHLNTMEYCADFNPTNLDMSVSLRGCSHPCLNMIESKHYERRRGAQDDSDDDHQLELKD